MKPIKYIISIMTLMLVVASAKSTVKAQIVTTPEGIKFDAQYYALANPELIAEYGDSFEGMYRHFLEHGKEEGRAPYDGYVANLPQGANVGPSQAFGNVTLNLEAQRVYVGDSRTYIMHNFIGDDNASWIGYPGTKYDTFAGAATSAIDSMYLNGKKIIILYGINDITSYGAQQTFNLYNAFLNTKAQEWINKGASVYFVSLVGITNDLVTDDKRVRNDVVNSVNNSVAAFNNMMAAFPANIHRIYISAGSNPFYDGIHYNEATSRSIYQQINSRL